MELIDLEKNPPIERLKTYEKMVLVKSWWDSVDFISPNLMGKYFKLYPEFIAEKTLGYVNSGELWLQRSALLFQLKYGAKTDLNLLFDYCTQLAGHKDFFIRKAIGWSLRQAGRKFPEAVIEFVENHELSNLSAKEALKHLK
jgi:3-methyladenine DNA glycosylase AlkD